MAHGALMVMLLACSCRSLVGMKEECSSDESPANAEDSSLLMRKSVFGTEAAGTKKEEPTMLAGRSLEEADRLLHLALGTSGESAPVVLRAGARLGPPASAGTAPQGQQLPTLFCFTWTPRRPHDDEFLPEVLTQYRKCDSHAVFTDSPPKPSAAGIYRVRVPPQSEPRSSDKWLYHRNTVGLWPAWAQLLQSGSAEKYDWVLNSELDHFMSPARVRENIVAFLDTLRSGSPEEQASIDGPLILAWGNAFVFNRKVVLEMKKAWDTLGKTARSEPALGCPEFMRGRFEWPFSCSQDIVYNYTPQALQPATVHIYGPLGCGQPDRANSKGVVFPLTCFEMNTNPMGSKEEEQIRTIQEFAALQHMKTEDEVKEHFRGTKWETSWELFFMSRNIPIIHHIASKKVHELARTLLDP